MQIVLPKLLWYQIPVVKALEDTPHKYVTFLASRRIGKSLVAKSMAIRWCLSERCNVGFVVPVGDLARKFIKEIVETLKGSGAVVGSNTVDKFVQFANGSLLYFHALDAFSRGAGNYKYMIFDECAFLTDDTFNAVFKPMTLEAKKVYFCSTPNGIGGVFYDNYNRGCTGKANPRYISFKCTLEESGLYSDEDVKEIKDTTPKAIYEQEYCCKFLSGGISAFGDITDRLVKDEATTGKYKRLYGGIDFSGAQGSNDSTVLTIVDEEGNAVFLKSWASGNVATMKEIAKILSTFNVRMTFAEENSIGAINIELLKQDWKKITPFVTSNTSKRDIVENVIVMFEKGKGTIFDRPEVRTQFASFIQDKTKSGKITYHNIRDDIHDDIVISYCLAQYARKMGEKRGNYFLS